MNLSLQLFNSLTRKKESLQTLEPGKIKFYSCGPTVWNLVHVGNLRSALVADLFYRVWMRLGYEVDYARNYTDVDDKIIQAAAQSNQSPEDLAKHFCEEVEKDFRAANILEPTHKPLVTENMEPIISLIQKIQERGVAYEMDGNVVFSVERFPEYGKLSGKKLEDLQAGARVEVNYQKANPLDFFLWKKSKDNEPSWDSPWGRGRPGWHIECSAMIQRLFGDQIDVHHGGVDLVFPHHENEIAQSEAGTGQAPFVRYWLHHAFVTINQEKMSKSLGNTFLAREFIDKFSGEVARALNLIPHYRSPIDFSPKSIATAFDSLERIYEAKQVAEECVAASSQRAEPSPDFMKKAESFEKEALEAFADDFHTPRFMAAYFEFLRSYNAIQYAGEASDRRAHAEVFLEKTKDWLSAVMGLGERTAKQALAELRDHRLALDGLEKSQASERPSESEIEALLAERAQARAAKNFSRSDEIRDQLLAQGVLVKDTPTGQSWSYK